MNIKLCEEYENLCFYIDWYKHKRHDGVEHFSYHAMIFRKDDLWNNIMTDDERNYIDNKRQANFETTMLMLELDHG